LEKLSKEIPNNTLIQFHNDGEPLMYPRLKDALGLFKGNIRTLNTNGKLLLAKLNDIVDNLDSIVISVIENDPEWEEQYQILTNFIKLKGSSKPNIVLRILGDIGEERLNLYKSLNLQTAYRQLHAPEGSFNYQKQTTVPEHGICLEMMSKLAIDRYGNVSPCVRFDPNHEFIIGNINDNTLDEIWNGDKRKEILQKHIDFKRNEIPFCAKCQFYGIPRG
jgi:radical SAM protein with 4Fe4S-binding SPASM domain